MPATSAAPALHTDELHRYCVWIVSPDGYLYSHAFDEVADGLSAAMTALGGSAPVVRSARVPDGRVPIILGGNLLPAEVAATLPAGSVVYNLEQVDPSSPWFASGAYLELLSRCRVLDYSPRNRDALIALGIAHAGLLEIGYSPVLERIPTAPEQDIDVLFYGSMNPRRDALLQRLIRRGLTVGHLFDAFGAERDAAIGRAKVVVNIHFYAAAVFEVVRVSYLLANGVCVATEGRPDDPDLAPYRDGLAVAGYHDLADTCVRLVRDADLRARLGEGGHKAMRARPQAEFLRRALSELAAPTASRRQVA